MKITIIGGPGAAGSHRGEEDASSERLPPLLVCLRRCFVSWPTLENFTSKDFAELCAVAAEVLRRFAETVICHCKMNKYRGDVRRPRNLAKAVGKTLNLGTRARARTRARANTWRTWGAWQGAGPSRRWRSPPASAWRRPRLAAREARLLRLMLCPTSVQSIAS